MLNEIISCSSLFQCRGDVDDDIVLIDRLEFCWYLLSDSYFGILGMGNQDIRIGIGIGIWGIMVRLAFSRGLGLCFGGLLPSVLSFLTGVSIILDGLVNKIDSEHCG